MFSEKLFQTLMPLNFSERLKIPCISLCILMYKPLYLLSTPKNTSFSLSFPINIPSPSYGIAVPRPCHPLWSPACIGHSSYFHVDQGRHFLSSVHQMIFLLSSYNPLTAFWLFSKLVQVLIKIISKNKQNEQFMKNMENKPNKMQ